MRRRFFSDRPLVPEDRSSSEKSGRVLGTVLRSPLAGVEAGAIVRRLKKEFVLFCGLLLPRHPSLFVNPEYVLGYRPFAGTAGEK